MDISIVVPTKNRFEYISKLINYYEKVEFNGILIIIDSSDEEILIKTKKLISKKNLKINYIIFRANEVASKAKIAHDIKTKYVIQAGDDDYYSVIGLKRIIEFLDNNQNFDCAEGYGYTVGYNLEKNYVKGIAKFYLETNDKETSYERIKETEIFGHVADYAVCRKELFQKIFNNLWYNNEKEPYIYLIRNYWEITFKFYRSLYSKSKNLNVFYMVRFRIQENKTFAQSIKNIYINDKRAVLRAYYIVIKKLIYALTKFEDKNSLKIYLIIKNKIKVDLLKRVDLYPGIRLISFFRRFKNILIALFLKIARLNRNQISVMTKKNSINYKKDFALIIESILSKN